MLAGVVGLDVDLLADSDVVVAVQVEPSHVGRVRPQVKMALDAGLSRLFRSIGGELEACHEGDVACGHGVAQVVVRTEHVALLIFPLHEAEAAMAVGIEINFLAGSVHRLGVQVVVAACGGHGLQRQPPGVRARLVGVLGVELCPRGWTDHQQQHGEQIL